LVRFSPAPVYGKRAFPAILQGLRMRQDIQPPFADMLGIKVIHSTSDRIEAELPVRPDLGNRNGNMHGGAVMALADDLGGAATIVNLPEGATTATIESKTNFFAAIHVGDTARAECIALHKGRTTMVWQTRITRASDGKLAAIVTQTQLVIAGKFGK
jgi:1,4-dihydroxy-2-naphthoyl-CoA hydrolase